MSNKTKLKFELVNKSGATMLASGKYQNAKREMVFLLKDGRVMKGTPTAEQDKQVKDIQVSSRMPLIEFFSAAEEDFWKEHPIVVVPGENGENRNKNCTNEAIRLINEEDETMRKINEKKLSLSAQNMVNNASNESLYNIAFAAGLLVSKTSASAYTSNDIYLLVMEWAERNPTEFKKLVERDDSEKLVVVNKAIALEKITFERGVYMYGTSAIGTSKDQVLAYFEQNKEQYVLLRRMVVQNDDLPIKFNDANVGSFDFSGTQEETKKPASKGK